MAAGATSRPTATAHPAPDSGQAPPLERWVHRRLATADMARATVVVVGAAATEVEVVGLIPLPASHRQVGDDAQTWRCEGNTKKIPDEMASSSHRQIGHGQTRSVRCRHATDLNRRWSHRVLR